LKRFPLLWCAMLSCRAWLPAVVLALIVSASSRGAQSAAPAAKGPSPRPLSPGRLAGDLYSNPALGFTYKIAFGWVDRTRDMQQDNEPGRSQLLLSVFERPPGAPGKEVDSAVVIAAESVSSYPGLKAAVDYFSPLTEITIAKGFQIVNQPYEFPVNGKPIVRADFRKQLGNGLVMQQSSLVLLAKDYLISFTFIAAGDEEMDDLIEKLSFGGKSRTP
jgi:hypothetical protein